MIFALSTSSHDDARYRIEHDLDDGSRLVWELLDEPPHDALVAKEVGKDSIHVNCVAPGFTMSEGVKSHPEVIEKLRDISIASRTIQRDQVPEDVVGAVVFLCTPAADFVTGQTMVIDGGQYFH